MAINDFFTSGLKAPASKRLKYGAYEKLKESQKESFREKTFSNFTSALAITTTLLAGVALIATATASGIGTPIIPFVAAAFVIPPLLTIVAPVINRFVSGTGTDRDPRVYIERQHENGKLKNVEKIPEGMSTSYFRRPSFGAMVAGATVGLLIGAISFAFPVTAPIAVTAMFGTALITSALGGMASAVIPSTIERTRFETKVREFEHKEANIPQKTREQKLDDIALKQAELELERAENYTKQDKLATSEVTNDARPEFISRIIDQRSTNKTSYVDKITAQSATLENIQRN